MNIEITSSTSVVLNDVKEKAVIILGNLGFRTLPKCNQSFSFDNETNGLWKSRGNFNYYQITEGRIDFTIAENLTNLKLTYNLDISFEIMILIISIAAAIFIAHLYFIATLVIILNLLIKLYTTKIEGREIVQSILSSN